VKGRGLEQCTKLSPAWKDRKGNEKWDMRFLAEILIQDLPSTKQKGRALYRGARSTTVSKYFATLTNFTSSPLKLEQ